MKLSYFCSIIRNNSRITVFNSFSSGVLDLNEEYSSQLDNFIETNQEDFLSAELKENLIKGRMLLEDDLNETDMIYILSNSVRYGNNNLSLTIAPTLSCNFKCPYCYENERRYNTMSKEIVKDTIKYIKKNSEKKSSIGVVWYGGEPLLALDTIEYISHKILELNIPYKAGIVTNGYLLTYDVAKKLREFKIDDVQVTLDGPKEIHDKRRILINDSPTFDTILNNIAKVCDIISIRIRVNVDKDNIELLPPLFDALDERGLKGKVSVYIAPVSNINNTCSSTTCLNDKEFAKEEINFYSTYQNRGYVFVGIPSCSLGICGAVSSSSFIIDPMGNLYKCWDDIGNEDEIVGNIRNPLSLSPNYIKWISYNPLNNEECKNCNILPLCMGGCPNYIIKGKNINCKSIKYVRNDYIDLVRKQKNKSIRV